MGRYYYGAIEGKFWFAIQSSGMIKDYGGWVDKKQYNWCGSDCTCRADKCDIYWSNCFGSFEEHKQAVLGEEEELQEDDKIEVRRQHEERRAEGRHEKRREVAFREPER